MTQFKYKFEKYEFKKFLLDSDPVRFRADKFIFWVGKIPLPDDIIFQVFDDRANLGKLYLDHVFAMMCLLQLVENRAIKKSALEEFPTETKRPDVSIKLLKEVLLKNKLKFRKLADDLSELLLIEGYSADITSILSALSHEGKKYNRIYLHPQIRDSITKTFKWFDYSSFRAQSDMFGNILADHYSIYRSGFSDALSGVFNKLIDFLISGSLHNSGEVSRTSSNIKILIHDEKSNDLQSHIVRKVMDGSIWEPAYVNNKIGFHLDDTHPFSMECTSTSNNKLILIFIQALSEMELNSFEERERKKIVNIRKDLSRMLKLKLESA